MSSDIFTNPCRSLACVSAIRLLGEVFGGKIVRAPTLMHGKISEIFHDSKGLFSRPAARISRNALSFA